MHGAPNLRNITLARHGAFQKDDPAKRRLIAGRKPLKRDPQWPEHCVFQDDPNEARRPHRPDLRWPSTPYPAEFSRRSTAALCADHGEED